MRWLSEARTRLTALLFRRREEREMDEELAFHLEMETEANVRRGLSRAEARRRALVSFGGVERAKEEVRDARGVGRVEELARDVRHALRALLAAPTFTVVAVLTLALGIGANTAVFSVVDAVLLRPLPYPESDRIVRLLEYEIGVEDRWGTISSPNFLDWRERATVFEAAALYDEYRPVLMAEGEPVRVSGASVSASYFEVLGVSPAAGRFFTAEEDEPGSARVVLGWSLWQQRFGGDPGILGSTVLLNDFPYTVVGVAPRGLADPGLSGSSFDPPRLWRSTPSYFETNGRGSRSFTALARLKPGVSLERAQDELTAIHAGLIERFPDANADRYVVVEPLKDDLVGDVRPALLILLSAVSLVLLIACANVANLLLFRAAGRGREIAVRAALGASRGRLLQYLMVESLLLALGGAALGLVVAWLATDALVGLAAGQIPRLDEVALDVRVLGFTATAAVATALVFGLVPALRATRADLASTIRAGDRSSTGGREGGRLGNALVAAEVALAVMVVVAGTLLARSLVRLQSVDPGMAVEQVVTAQVDPPFDPYFSDEADTLGLALDALYGRLSDRLLALPGVEAVGQTDILPLSGGFNGAPYSVPAQDGESHAQWRAVTPGYFAAMGIPIVRGRGILPSDDGVARKVVVVNQTFARRHWPNGGGVGETILKAALPDAGPDESLVVVGIVGDVAEFSLDRDPEATAYFPNPQAPGWMRDDQTLVVRTTLDADAAVAAIRAAVREVEPRMPVSTPRAMEAVLARTLVQPRFRAFLLSAFALLSLVLAGIGVYGLIANRVAGRRREIGVRLALGASSGQVTAMVLRQGLRVALIGTAAGLLGAFAAGRLLSSMLFGVATTDPFTFAVVPLALLGVAALAVLVPARRAAGVAPMQVLRED